MSARWAIVAVLGGLACSAQPSFPRDMGETGGAGRAGGAGTTGTAAEPRSTCVVKPAPGPRKSAELGRMRYLPSGVYAVRTHCIEQCMRQLYIPIMH
jgi:hypothetical protein